MKLLLLTDKKWLLRNHIKYKCVHNYKYQGSGYGFVFCSEQCSHTLKYSHLDYVSWTFCGCVHLINLFKRLLNAVQVHCLHANNLSVPKTSELPLKDSPCLFCESWCMKGIRGVYSLKQKRITKKSHVPGACTSVCTHYSYQHNSIGKWNSDIFKRLFN